VIAVIGKPKTLPLINTDDTDQKKREDRRKHPPQINADDADRKKQNFNHRGHEGALRKNARVANHDRSEAVWSKR